MSIDIDSLLQEARKTKQNDDFEFDTVSTFYEYLTDRYIALAHQVRDELIRLEYITTREYEGDAKIDDNEVVFVNNPCSCCSEEVSYFCDVEDLDNTGSLLASKISYYTSKKQEAEARKSLADGDARKKRFEQYEKLKKEFGG